MSQRTYVKLKNASKSDRKAILKEAKSARKARVSNKGLGIQRMDLDTEVKRVLTREAMKAAGYVDRRLDHYWFLSTWSAPGEGLNYIPLVAKGDSIQERVGAKIKAKSLQIRGTIVAGTIANSIDNISMMLVLDRDPTGTHPSVTDILNGTEPGYYLNDANRMRFAILRRWDYQLGCTGATPSSATDAPNQVFVDEYYKFKGVEITYSGASSAGTGGVGDIKKNAIYLMCIGTRGGDLTTSAVFLRGCDDDRTVATNAAVLRFRFADVHG